MEFGLLLKQLSVRINPNYVESNSCTLYWLISDDERIY